MLITLEDKQVEAQQWWRDESGVHHGKVKLIGKIGKDRLGDYVHSLVQHDGIYYSVNSSHKVQSSWGYELTLHLIEANPDM